ncbi:MAG: hypothetical protein AAF357_13270 [Verrucomicrobiota bacterium]
MDPFENIGIQIANQWKSDDSTDEFVRVSSDILSRSSFDDFDIRSVLEWAGSKDLLPRQHNFQSPFGEPALTVYSGEGFYLELLFWFTSCTAIHGHGFAGAFRVLHGHSLQTEYVFQLGSAVCEGVESGDLILNGLRLIGPGDISSISPGDEFTHCVAHLGCPSITLVARTIYTRGVKQYSYSRSGLAWLPFHRKEDIGQRLALINTLKRIESIRYREAILELVRGGDPHRCLMVLLSLSHQGADSEWLDDVAKVGCTDSQHREQLMNAVLEVARKNRIWKAIDDFPESQRLRIALGELFGSEAKSLHEIEKYYPSNPAEETLHEWEGEISL